MFEKARGCIQTKRSLVCSLITISENAAPMTLIQGNGSSVQLQETRVPGFFIPKNNSDLQHQHNEWKCQSITTRDDLELELNFLTHCLAVNISLKFILNFHKITKFYPEHDDQ